MSALSTPFIHTTKTIDGVATPINIEQITGIDKITISENQAIGSRPVYDIIFIVGNHGMNPKEIKWRYADEETRDDDYDGILAIVSSEVVPAS